MSLLDTTTGNCSKGSMGISFGLQSEVIKRQFRWMFRIPEVSADGTNSLPPRKGARPGINLKEFEFQHLSESIWYPMKPEWKTVNLTLYDIGCNENPVFKWLTDIYDPSSLESKFEMAASSEFLTNAKLELYDGMGTPLETWNFSKCYPQSIDWGTLDMDSSDFVVCDLTLRYQRATVE